MPADRRVRLDLLLVERGLAESRTDAQALLLAGQVIVEGLASRTLKPGQLVRESVEVRLVERPRYASRAGEKLAAALDAFDVDPAGLTCLDSGASTGGFTDVLLQRGARRVYAVDVGRGQLIERLRQDPRVVSMEATNLRTLDALPEPIDLATLDLSFISLRLVMGAVRRLMRDAARAVALVKPQFEAGRADVPRGGVIRDPAVHTRVLERFRADAADAGFVAVGLIRSPLTGQEGNVEFLADLRCAPGPRPIGDWSALVRRVVGPGDGAAAAPEGR